MTEYERGLRDAAKVADDWAAVADAAFLTWQERARKNMDGMDVAGGCAIGMAHQARRIAEAIRARASVGEHAKRENSRSEVEARRAADAVPSEETADAQTPQADAPTPSSESPHA